jgi:hypothetical protein
MSSAIETENPIERPMVYLRSTAAITMTGKSGK